MIIMEAISREFRVALPWELLYADDLAVIAETEEELIERLNEWKDNVESKGLRVNMKKTNYLPLVAAPISGPPTFLGDVNFFFLYIAIMTGENLQ